MKIGRLHVAYETEDIYGHKEAELEVHYDDGRLVTKDSHGEEDWLGDFRCLKDALAACFKMFVGKTGFEFVIERSNA